MRLYVLPAGISFLSHIYAVYVLALGPENHPLSPVLKLMVCNFTAIAASMLYWVTIESSPRIALTMLLCSIIAGRGSV